MLTRAEMESRRLKAIPDLQSKISGGRLAVKYGVTPTSIARWRRALRIGKGLGSTQAPGRPNSLKPALLLAVYRDGPRAFGFPFDRWTTESFASAVGLRHGVYYHRDHAGRLLHKYTPWKGRKKERSAGA